MPRALNESGASTAPQPQAHDSLEILTSPTLSQIDGIVHGVTKRLRGLGKADGNIGYSAPRDRDDAWDMRKRWLASAGLDAEMIVVAHQTHGNGVAIATAIDAGRGAMPGSMPLAQADALLSREPGVVLLTLHADCMPILLCDPIRRVVASIHAGWRGTVVDVCGATAREMNVQFGTRPEEIVAFLGPAIGSCCYEVGNDVYNAWLSAGADSGSHAIHPRHARFAFDLAAANRTLLERAGVRPERIETSGICTRCNGDEWFSHRGQGADTGRYGAFIALTDLSTRGA